MAQNVTLQGASYQDVPSVVLPKTGGGSAVFTDTSDTTAVAGDVMLGKDIYLADGSKATGTLKFDWMGKNAEYLGQIYSLSDTLNNTGYNGWSPSTTAKVIVASETLSDTVVMDLEHYEYFITWVSDCNVAYNSSWSASKGSPLRVVCLYTQTIFRRPATKENADAGIFNYNAVQQGSIAIYWLYYWSSASAKSLAYTTYSPAYISAVTASTFSSTSSLTPTVTIKTPAISARCSTTYFTTANAGKVDQANTTVKMKGYLYRVAVESSTALGSWAYLDNVWRNPL